MAVQVVSVSLQPETIDLLDAMAHDSGLSRSAMVARLVEAEEERRLTRGRGLDVTVEGVRYVPRSRRR